MRYIVKREIVTDNTEGMVRYVVGGLGGPGGAEAFTVTVVEEGKASSSMPVSGKPVVGWLISATATDQVGFSEKRKPALIRHGLVSVLLVQ
jgi:hypothetical protein